MSAETVTAWATAITAVGALALIVVTLRVEYSRRRHEIGQVHYQQLRELVFEPLKQELVEHYLSVLDRRDGLLMLISEEKASKFDPLNGKIIEWTMNLAIKSASITPGGTFGEHQRFVDYEATFPHLYLDAKTAHFPELFQRWEAFRERVQLLGEQSLGRSMSWQQRLEEQIGYPNRYEHSDSRPWCNYVAFALYIYEQLWRRYPNGAGLFQESGYSALRYQSCDLIQGDQKNVERCLKAVSELIKTESISELIKLGEELAQEAFLLKGEFERLVLTQLPLGACPYLKVPPF